MANRGPQSFKKRQKEQQRKEKQQEKVAKRLDRKLNPDQTVEPELEVLEESLTLAEIESRVAGE